MIYSRSEFKNVSRFEIFRMEVEKQIIVLNDNLLAVENQIATENPEALQRLESLMRAAHSIKGAARIVGLDDGVRVAHALEDCFVASKKGQLNLASHHIDVLLSGIDWFSQLGNITDDTHAQWLSEHVTQTNQLIEALGQILVEPAIQPVIQATTTAQPISSPEPASTPNPSKQPVRNNDEASDAKPKENLPTRNSKHSSNENGHQNAHQNDRADRHSDRIHSRLDSGESSPSISSGGDSEPTSERVVRVNADNLNQLMALAGESLVEVNWLQPFADTMQHLRKRQQSLTALLDQLQQAATLSPSGKKTLEEAKSVALDCHALLSDRIGDLDQFSRRFSQLSDNLYREVIASHMRPFSDGTQRFQRMVRDLAREQGKKAKLQVVGQNTRIDRDILDRLEAPLTHMLRNAIAHGIEFPERRQQIGKPEIGTIRLEATHRAGMLSITVSDDGCGIDLEALRQSVIEKQLASPAIAERLSDAELMEFLFLPGFSTAQSVTEIAGRGVGLDIAKSMVQDVGGLLRAFSAPEEGMTFHFQLPLTLSVIRVLVVEISGEPYAFGLTRIEQVKLITPEDIFISETHPYIVVDDETISLVEAHRVLELPVAEREPTSTLPVIIVKDHAHSYGIVVDQLVGEKEIVVRPLDERFGKIQDVSAAALTDEGYPLLIIDVADFVRSIEQMASGESLDILSDRSSNDTKEQKHVLVVDDSLTVREMERQLLQNHGYQVDVAVNGMEGWNTVRTGSYDLVISDIDMPRMNGIELVEQIKAHPQLRQLPVIIVSYKDRQSDKVAGLNAGADYYLTKSSFQDNSLLDAVADLIG
ncbi:MAG: hybrid sensor histidine kinase/response regulator [Cyanobacteria bacterium P01_F01_bin.3]